MRDREYKRATLETALSQVDYYISLNRKLSSPSHRMNVQTVEHSLRNIVGERGLKPLLKICGDNRNLALKDLRKIFIAELINLEFGCSFVCCWKMSMLNADDWGPGPVDPNDVPGGV